MFCGILLGFELFPGQHLRFFIRLEQPSYIQAEVSAMGIYSKFAANGTADVVLIADISISAYVLAVEPERV